MRPPYEANSQAEERLAKFLLSISTRLRKRHFSMSKFNLSMSRQDIASYLGLTTETVSRLFTQLQKNKILTANRRQIELHNMRVLQIMACGGDRKVLST